MSADASQIGIWVSSATSILTLFMLMRKFSGQAERREITPQPLEVKPSPEYALRAHSHPEYITREDCHAAHMQASQTEASRIEQVQRQLDHFSNEMKATLQKHNESAESRASKLHSRIDPIAQLAQSTTDRLEDHFEDHRAGRLNHAG